MSTPVTSRIIFKVSLLQSAAKQFSALPNSDQLRLKPRIDALGRKPRPPDAVLISKGNGYSLYRIIVVNFRIIYEIKGRNVLIVSIKT